MKVGMGLMNEPIADYRVCGRGRVDTPNGHERL